MRRPTVAGAAPTPGPIAKAVGQPIAEQGPPRELRRLVRHIRPLSDTSPKLVTSYRTP
jgi:hypothetical protein